MSETLTSSLSRFVTKNYRFAMFVYFCVSKDYPETKWNGSNWVTAPISPEIFASYALFIKRKFPLAVAEAPFSIENA